MEIISIRSLVKWSYIIYCIILPGFPEMVLKGSKCNSLGSSNFFKMIRFMVVSGLAVGVLMVPGFLIQPVVHAEPAAGPAYQDGYPGVTQNPQPTTDSGYPGVTQNPQPTTDSGYPGSTQNPQPTSAATRTRTPTSTFASRVTSAARSATPTFTVTQPSANQTQPTPGTVVSTPTQSNIYLTENAEMGTAQVTPQMTQTAVATDTPTPSGTQTPDQTGGAPLPGDRTGGFNMNWGLFWIGFAVPVIFACAGVLYLVDRRPDIFSLPKR